MATGPSAQNISLLRYSETDADFCEPFTVCGAGDYEGMSRDCPLWGRKDKSGFGTELELQFRANAGDVVCSSNPNSSMTITFVMTKGEQPNPQRVYDSSDDGASCNWTARWAGLPEFPRPELDIARESKLIGDIAAAAVLGVAAVAILGVCHTMLGRGHRVQSSGRPSEAFADWAPTTDDRATADSIASLDSHFTDTGSSMSEHLLSARRKGIDSSVDAAGSVRNSGSIQ